MTKTIRFYLKIKDAPEKLELENGFVGSQDYIYDNEYPLDENGVMIDDNLSMRHFMDVNQKLIEDFITVQYKEIENDEGDRGKQETKNECGATPKTIGKPSP